MQARASMIGLADAAAGERIYFRRLGLLFVDGAQNLCQNRLAQNGESGAAVPAVGKNLEP
jgi:hypothetical protein